MQPPRRRARAARPAPLAASFLAALVALPAAPAAQAPPRPRAHAVRDVALGRGAEAPRVTLLLAHGRIEAVLAASDPVPPGRVVVEGAGLVALPAFVDAWTRHGVAADPIDAEQDVPVDVAADVRVDMRLANRKGIDPAFRAAEALAPEAEAWTKRVDDWHGAGFGAACVAPGDALLAGTSALVAVRDAAARDLVIVPDVFAHAAFSAEGEGYPSTHMGYHAQLRQLFLDARWHAERSARYAAGRPGARPPFDATLAAAGELLAGGRRVLCQAERGPEIERWLRLGGELGLAVGVAGGREAWRSAERLAERGAPVVLTLEWGEEVEDPGTTDEPTDEPWIYEEPLEARRERRRLWEEARDGALALHRAGVPFAFGTGKGTPKDLLAHVREIVAAGLPADAALAALTSEAARLCGAERRLGAIEPGRDATLVLWTGDPLTDEDARPAWVFVDGFAHEMDLPEEGEEGPPAEGVTATGRWELAHTSSGDGPDEVVLVLEMEEDGVVKGTMEWAFGGTQGETALEGRLSGDELTLEGEVELGQDRLGYRLRGTVAGDELEGETTVHTPWSEEPTKRSYRATRAPEERP